MFRKLRSASLDQKNVSYRRGSIFTNNDSHSIDDGLNPEGRNAGKKSSENLNLALKNLDRIPEFIIRRYEKHTKCLDLSYNNISDLNSLSGFDHLETLVLDHNKISCHTSFPVIFSLKMLSVNNNEISNLSVFVKNIAQSYGHLKYLSMMNNDAAPSYLNGGSVEQFQDYRNFVISHFAALEVLDCTPISTEERDIAYKVYGRRWKIRRRTRTNKT